MLLLLSAGPAFADAEVRFVHAVPGAGAAQVKVTAGKQRTTIPATSFGDSSSRLEVRSGSVTWTLVGGGETLAKLGDEIEDGRDYTLVALAKPDGQGASLKLFEDVKPKRGTALVRAIHATPELGEPDVMVGDRIVAEKLGYGEATDYASVPPGTYDVAVMRSGGEGAPLAEDKDVALTAGSATTEIVVGSRGEETRLMSLSDGTAAPKGAPQTGFGGLAGDDPPPRWLVGLLSALAGAMLGATGLAIAGRRH